MIVSLVPGAQLPPQFRRFRREKEPLEIINGVVLELPNRVVKQLETMPEVFRVHTTGRRPASTTAHPSPSAR